MTNKHPYWVFVPPRKNFIIRGYDKLQDFMIHKAGNDWGVPLTWVAIVLAILLIILFVLLLIKIGKAIKNYFKAKNLQKAARSKLRRHK